MSTNVGKDGPWYTSKRMWSLGIAGLCMVLRWAGVNVPYTSEELTGIIYPVVEAGGVALAAWWTLRADRKLTGLPGITAGDSGPEKPANLDDPGRHFSYLWLMVPLAALGLSGCMGLGPYADPRTAYKTNNSQTFQPDEFSIVLNIPPAFKGTGPLFAIFAPIGTTGSGAFQGNQQADTAADLGVQSDSARSTMARTGQQTLGSGEGAATGAPVSPAYTETKPVTVDLNATVPVSAAPGSIATGPLNSPSAGNTAPSTAAAPAVLSPDPAIPIVLASDVAGMTPEAKAAMKAELEGHLDRLNRERAALNLSSEPGAVAQNFLDWQTVTARLKLLE